MSKTIDHVARRERGAELYREIMCAEPPLPTTPRTATLLDFVFAEVWARPGLERRARRLVTLTATAGSSSKDTFAANAYGALASGDLSIDELGEFVLHFGVYCGWGQAETAESIIQEQWRRLLAERGELHPGNRIHPVSDVPADQEERKQRGERHFAEINCVPAVGRGVPYQDDGILNFVFGDMWLRPGLSVRDRRWITIAAVGISDTAIPIQSHVGSALESGDVSIGEMLELCLQFAVYAGWPKGSMLNTTIAEQWARVEGKRSVAGG